MRQKSVFTGRARFSKPVLFRSTSTLGAVNSCLYKEIVRDNTPEDAFFRELSTTCADLRQAFALQVGMSAHRVQMFIRLWRHGETSHSDLRRALGVDGASITRLVKEFESDGLIGRRLDPGDNRYTLAALTPAGERVAADLELSHQAYQQQLLEGITAGQQQTVLDVLRRIRANITEPTETT